MTAHQSTVIATAPRSAAIDRIIRCIRRSDQPPTAASMRWLRARLLHAEHECTTHGVDAHSICVGIHHTDGTSELLDFSSCDGGPGSHGHPPWPRTTHRPCITLLVVAFTPMGDVHVITHDETSPASAVGEA